MALSPAWPLASTRAQGELPFLMGARRGAETQPCLPFIFRWPGCSGETEGKWLHAGRSKLQAPLGTGSNMGLNFDATPSSSLEREGEQWHDQPKWLSLTQHKRVFKLPVHLAGNTLCPWVPCLLLGRLPEKRQEGLLLPAAPSPDRRRPCCVLSKCLSLKKRERK